MFNLNDEFISADGKRKKLSKAEPGMHIADHLELDSGLGKKKKAADAGQASTAEQSEKVTSTVITDVNDTAKKPDKPEKPAKKLRPLNGRSILEYAQLEIDHSATLLGDRYLCRGGGMFIVAPSGQGKSTLAIQMAAEWALGWASLDIRPPYPLRTLIIQAEDDEGDVHEMSEWIVNHCLSSEQRVRVLRDTRVELVNDVCGLAFVDALDEILQQWPADIVIINPYTSFIGGDAKDEGLANMWLRVKLNPVLAKHKAAAIIIHHTPKIQYANSDDYTTSEFQYRGAGCASMTNWARAYLVFEPLRDHENVFQFRAAKRGKRIGWASTKRYFKHSDNEMRWEAASAEEAREFDQESKSKGNRTVTVIPAAVLQRVSIKPERFELVAERVAKELGLGINRAKKELDLLEMKGGVFYTFLSVNNSGGKGGRKAKFVAKPVEAEEVKQGQQTLALVSYSP
jgi:AAA domain-containing protein